MVKVVYNLVACGIPVKNGTYMTFIKDNEDYELLMSRVEDEEIYIIKYTEVVKSGKGQDAGKVLKF